MTADLWNDLQATVVPAIVSAPVDELAFTAKEALEGHKGSGGGTVQQLTYLLERILQIEVHLVDSSCHGRGHCFAR